MFSTLHKTNLTFLVTLILLSANAFNLDQSQILAFGKELTHYKMKNYRLFQMESCCRRQIRFQSSIFLSSTFPSLLQGKMRN